MRIPGFPKTLLNFIVLTACFSVLLFVVLAATKQPPTRLDEVNLVRALHRGVNHRIIEQKVSEQGVSFDLDSGVEDELREAGASDSLIYRITELGHQGQPDYQKGPDSVSKPDDTQEQPADRSRVVLPEKSEPKHTGISSTGRRTGEGSSPVIRKSDTTLERAQQVNELLSDGQTQKDAGNYDDAIRSAQKALDIDPGSGAARRLLAESQKAKAAEEEIRLSKHPN